MWSVVVLEKKERCVENFKEKEEALEFLALTKKNFPKAIVGLVSRNKAIPPDNSIPRPKPKKNKAQAYWCPYCGDYRHFVSGTNGKKCPICGISDADYYVKLYNSLWK